MLKVCCQLRSEDKSWNQRLGMKGNTGISIKKKRINF